MTPTIFVHPDETLRADEMPLRKRFPFSIFRYIFSTSQANFFPSRHEDDILTTVNNFPYFESSIRFIYIYISLGIVKMFPINFQRLFFFFFLRERSNRLETDEN